MYFNLKNLDIQTRTYMEQEFNFDIQSNKLYLSPRLNNYGSSIYHNLFLNAIRSGGIDSFTESLKDNNCLKSTEIRRKPKGGFTEVKIPVNAAEMLAEGEFNRFYIRGLCLRASNENKNLIIYRAKEASNPRPESEALIGKVVSSIQGLLEDLRENIGVDTAFGLPAGPNSGISVELI